jgi:hypothetical protein
MWHDLRDISDSYFFDPDHFAEFAHQNSAKYKVVNDAVSTWYSNDLVSEYRNTYSERVELDYKRYTDELKRN